MKKFPDSRHSSLSLCVCVCKHGPATYMVTKAQSRAHTSDIKHTYGPLRPNYFKFTPWRKHYRSDTPTPRSRLAEALGNVEWAGCDWRRGGAMGGDARRRPRPAWAAPRTITAGRSSTTEWKKKEGRGRKEKKKREKRERGEGSELVRSFCGLQREVWSAATRIHTEPLEFLTTPNVCIWLAGKPRHPSAFLHSLRRSIQTRRGEAGSVQRRPDFAALSNFCAWNRNAPSLYSVRTGGTDNLWRVWSARTHERAVSFRKCSRSSATARGPHAEIHWWHEKRLILRRAEYSARWAWCHCARLQTSDALAGAHDVIARWKLGRAARVHGSARALGQTWIREILPE